MASLPDEVARRWLWWRLGEPPRRNTFTEGVEAEPQHVRWRTQAETERLLSLMSPLHRAKVAAAALSGRRHVGTVYRRTRDNGRRSCPARGSAVRRGGQAPAHPRRWIEPPAHPGGAGASVRSRLLSPRETARLAGLPDSHVLPARATVAYHLTGDGVVAPVVAYLARELLEPLLGLAPAGSRLAA